MEEHTVGNLTAVPATHFRWDIPNFNLLPKNYVYAVISPPFSWEDAKWNFQLYPNGKSGCNPAWIVLGLVRHQASGQEHRVKIKFDAVRPDGVLETCEGYHIFCERNLSFEGVLPFVDRDTLTGELCEINPNPEISVSCTMITFEGIPDVKLYIPPPKQP